MNDIGVELAADWPEAKRFNHISYTSDGSGIVTGSMSLCLQRNVATTDFRVGIFTHGTVQLAVDGNGMILRGPPFEGTLRTLPRSQPLRFYNVAVDHWVAAVAFALLPLWMIFRFSRSHVRRHIRHKRNLCPNCGYDVRASADLCPECGTKLPNRYSAAE
jgi:hypothetical protein